MTAITVPDTLFCPRSRYAGLGARTFKTKLPNGNGFEFGVILGRGADVRLVIPEVKDWQRLVRGGNLTAFGLGSGGRRVLDRNIEALQRGLQNVKLSPLERGLLTRQIRRGTFDIQLIGNAAKGTRFAPDALRQLRGLTNGQVLRPFNINVP